jgi:mono/diheme cytochrome c family protein
MRTEPKRAVMKAVMAGFVLAACSNAPEPAADAQTLLALPVPTELREGARQFETHCWGCHGPAGTGSDAGPPLVHKVYEPSHHGDAAFRLAISRGVAAHHWRFGDMPPVPAVTAADADAIIAYVRWLQKNAGIE